MTCKQSCRVEFGQHQDGPLVTGWLLSLSEPYLLPSKQKLIIPLMMTKGNLAQSRSQLLSSILSFVPSATNPSLLEISALRCKQHIANPSRYSPLSVCLPSWPSWSPYGTLSLPLLPGSGSCSQPYILLRSIYLPNYGGQVGEQALLPNKPLPQTDRFGIDLCCLFG